MRVGIQKLGNFGRAFSFTLPLETFSVLAVDGLMDVDVDGIWMVPGTMPAILLILGAVEITSLYRYIYV